MNFKEKHWDIMLKHIIHTALYSEFSLSYSGAIVDIVKSWKKFVIFVTIPFENLTVTLRFKYNEVAIFDEEFFSSLIVDAVKKEIIKKQQEEVTTDDNEQGNG